MFRDPVTVEGRKAVGTLHDFPLFFGTVLFALEAIGVVSAIKYLCYCKDFDVFSLDFISV